MIQTVRSLRCWRCLCSLEPATCDYYTLCPQHALPSPGQAARAKREEEEEGKKKLRRYKLTNRIRGPQQVKPLLFHANVIGHHPDPTPPTPPPFPFFFFFFFFFMLFFKKASSSSYRAPSPLLPPSFSSCPEPDSPFNYYFVFQLCLIIFDETLMRVD